MPGPEVWVYVTVGFVCGSVWARRARLWDRWDAWLYGPLPPVRARHERDRSGG
jgi:hypothetical protein